MIKVEMKDDGGDCLDFSMVCLDGTVVHSWMLKKYLQAPHFDYREIARSLRRLSEKAKEHNAR